MRLNRLECIKLPTAPGRFNHYHPLPTDFVSPFLPRPCSRPPAALGACSAPQSFPARYEPRKLFGTKRN